MSDQIRYITFAFQLCIDPVLSVWSIISGTVNIIAFYRIGLRDGVNQNFFILSVADTLQGFVGLGSGVCYILEWANLFFRAVTFSKLQNLFPFIHSFPLSVSIITTTVIAVVRCCCVTMPFTVQRVLTARTQLAAILVLTGATIIIYIFASVHINLDSDGPSPNTTNTFFFSSQAVLTVWDGAKCALFFSSFLVISVSIVTLIIALKKSSRFQQRATTSGLSIVMESRSVRDARVIRGILQVLVIFTICNSFVIIIAILGLVRPDFAISLETREEFLYLDIVKSFFLLINTSVNVFVYYFNNERFKKAVNELCCVCT